MYIQEESAERERTVPPDYKGHTYAAESILPTRVQAQETYEEREEEEGEKTQKSTPVGAFLNKDRAECGQKGGKRGDLFGGLGLGNLLSRVPFLSSLAPPPRTCAQEERKHGGLWDWVLLAIVALSLLNGKDDDVLPLLLLLLLWD